MNGWRFELASGEERSYAGVVVVNGHDWKSRQPSYPGTFTGRQLHSKQYRTPEDFDGERVLVVGGGNSACDIAVEAATTLGSVDISMRNGSWFVPKMIAGLPMAERDRIWLPTPLLRAFVRTLIRIRFGQWARYGLPAPSKPLFENELVINEQLLYFLKHGKVFARPGIERLHGNEVHFADGTAGTYDTIVWATGYEVGFPFLDEALLRWDSGSPVLLDHLLPPRLANLYLFGLLKPLGGAGRLIGDGSDVVVRLVRAQEGLAVPLSELAALTTPRWTALTANELVSLPGASIHALQRRPAPAAAAG